MRSSLPDTMPAKTEPPSNGQQWSILCVCGLFPTDQRQNHVTRTADHPHRRHPRQWLQVSWRFRSTSYASPPGYTALSSFDSSILSQFPEAPPFGHLILQVNSTKTNSKNSIKSSLRRPLLKVFWQANWPSRLAKTSLDCMLVHAPLWCNLLPHHPPFAFRQVALSVYPYKLCIHIQLGREMKCETK